MKTSNLISTVAAGVAFVSSVVSKLKSQMNTYEYATDSTSGTVKADSLEAAYASIRSKITDEMIEDGATLWVADEDGNRLTL